MVDPRLEAARALLDPWDHADVEKVALAARILEEIGSLPQSDVLPLVARATRVVLFLRREASSKEKDVAGRMVSAAADLERSTRTVLKAAAR